MSNTYYEFVTHWRVSSTVEEIMDILRNPADLARWWPSVYLQVKILHPGGPDGLGRVIDLYTKGWLPYTLRWQFTVTDNSPGRLALRAQGDFDGEGVWIVEQDGEWVNITYDWRIMATKPLLRYLSFMMKPIFSANHHWAMAQGEESLKLELARRHAPTEAEKAKIPAPPGPTFSFLYTRPG